MTRGLAGLALIALIAGCGSATAAATTTTTTTPSSSSPSPPARSPSVPASSTPVPSADTEEVEVITTGVGAYDLQVVPVALLRNRAARHDATAVVVTFTVRWPGGAHLLAVSPVSLGPGETLAVAALCTDACQGATTASASVQVGGWSSAPVTQLPPAPATFVCGSPCAGRGGFEGAVTASLRGSLAPGTVVNLFASCTSAGGRIVGGGVTTVVWGSGASPANAPATPRPASVPVLTAARPSACQVDGSPAG